MRGRMCRISAQLPMCVRHLFHLGRAQGCAIAPAGDLWEAAFVAQGGKEVGTVDPLARDHFFASMCCCETAVEAPCHLMEK